MMVLLRRHHALLATIFLLFHGIAAGEQLFHEWHVAGDTTVKLNGTAQKVITINGMFPGPLINATTNDVVHVNVFNELDEPLLFTWNGIQQRLNSWQDGVSGTNCPIQPGSNWTAEFQVKDQIGTFFYFPSTNFQKAGGGFGPIRVHNRATVKASFPKPEEEFDLLVGDWYTKNYKEVKSMLGDREIGPLMMLMNGKGPYSSNTTDPYEKFTVKKGKTYLFRISNVGTSSSFNFRIQDHTMLLVETEGSYSDQITLRSLDVHVGQSYSVLVTADRNVADYYIVASPKLTNGSFVGVSVLHYENSTKPATGPLPNGPNPFDLDFSIKQANSIKWNLTAGAARPNPQGTFNVSNVTIVQTFILTGSSSSSPDEICNSTRYSVNNVSYETPATPLKLADYFVNGSNVYEVDRFSTNSSNGDLQRGVFVASGLHKGYVEIVFQNEHDNIDTWHLDGFNFFVVGYGYNSGKWTIESRKSYNLRNPISRSTVQVYPGGWATVYAYLDNPGMWNLRSQNLRHWYLGQELYIRVYDPDPNPAKERPPPQNLLYCGIFSVPPSPPVLHSPPPPSTPSQPLPVIHSPPPPPSTPSQLLPDLHSPPPPFPPSSPSPPPPPPVIHSPPPPSTPSPPLPVLHSPPPSPPPSSPPSPQVLHSPPPPSPPSPPLSPPPVLYSPLPPSPPSSPPVLLHSPPPPFVSVASPGKVSWFHVAAIIIVSLL